MKKLLLITTGGTIASKYDAALGGDVPSSDTFDTASFGLFHLEVEQTALCNIDSSQMNFDLMCRLATLVNASSQRFDAIVITHGTDTLEETSFFLRHTYTGNCPVVLTASMRSSDSVGADGPVNLKDAFITAASDSTPAGVYVVINSQIFDAREIHKSSTSNVATFMAPWSGPLGYVDDESVFFRHAPLDVRIFNIPEKVLPVHIIKAQVSVDALYLTCAVQAGVKGIVIEGFGRGNIPSDMIFGIDLAISHGIPVVITSRCGSGRVLDSYACPGSAMDSVKHGAILGGDLTSEKARILLALYLSSTNRIDLDHLQDIFSK